MRTQTRVQSHLLSFLILSLPQEPAILVLRCTQGERVLPWQDERERESFMGCVFPSFRRESERKSERERARERARERERESARALYRTPVACCRLVGCSVVSGRPLRSRAVRGCRSASASAWGPFWPPVPRPRLRPPREPGGGGARFPLRGGVWAE